MSVGEFPQFFDHIFELKIMKQTFLIIFLANIIALNLGGCKFNSASDPDNLSITLKNPTDFARQDEIISLPLNDVLTVIKSTPDDLRLKVPFQIIDIDNDGTNDQLNFLMNFEPHETKNIKLSELVTEETITFPKRTQAEISHKENGEWKGREYMGGTFKNVTHLKVPPEHTDHSWYIRYEGPGWESDKVGYRFYLDWRNATDIFGKSTTEMVLQNIGQDGFDSYHEASDWGMDVLKVGQSLGIGSIGIWQEGKAKRVAKTDSLETQILANGEIFSKVRTTYYGWEIDDNKIDLISDLSIAAGSRMTHQNLEIKGTIENICTGIVKHAEADMFDFSQPGKTGWGYIATYGKQSLNNDKLGMAILFKNDDLIEITEDDHSHVVVLMPKHKTLDYYFLAAWELEKDGIKNKDEFINYLNKSIEQLNKPIETTL